MIRDGQGDLPLPRWERSTVVAEAPGAGPGNWTGAPSAIFHEGAIYLAYRLRRPVGRGRGYANVVARSEDGEQFEVIEELTREDLDAESLERPALAITPEGTWRLYLSCAAPEGPGWWIDVLEGTRPDGLRHGNRVTVLPGDAATGVKDPVVAWSRGLWHLWVCCHRIAVPVEADQAYTAYATSRDGIQWAFHGTCLTGRTGRWDARMARIGSVLIEGGGALAYYDGRASVGENGEERLGLAAGASPASFLAEGEGPAAVSPYGTGSLRYVDFVPLPDGTWRLFYEAARPDGAHDLRTELVAAWG